MTDMDLRARIFISCGQGKDSDEPRIAQDIADRLEGLGYDTYVAVQRQSLNSLRENIFDALRNAEYFLFVDFPRERLVALNGDDRECRGSLFSHQELAIASYLSMPVLAFRDKRVKDLDGIAGHLQVNCIPFSDWDTLPELVEAQVRRRWSPKWRNALGASLDGASPHRVEVNDPGRYARFYLLRVENAHREIVARDCCAYIRKIINLTDGQEQLPATAELKWAGSLQANVAIMPGSFREVDAFWILESQPCQPRFNILTDSTRHVPQLVGPGEWELTYEIISSNVQGTHATIRLSIDDSGKTSLR